MISLYLFLMMLITLMIYHGFHANLKSTPHKIKVLSIVALITILLRCLSLFTLFFTKDMLYLYLLKPFVFLDIIYIPLIILICVYIFSRNVRVNFSYAFVLAFVFMIIFLVVTYKGTFNIKYLEGYGYFIDLAFKDYLNWGFILVNSAVLIYCTITLGSKQVITKGVLMLLFSSLLFMLEIMLHLLGIELLPLNLIGEAMYILTLNYGLSTFKQSKY